MIFSFLALPSSLEASLNLSIGTFLTNFLILLINVPILFRQGSWLRYLIAKIINKNIYDTCKLCQWLQKLLAHLNDKIKTQRKNNKKTKINRFFLRQKLEYWHSKEFPENWLCNANLEEPKGRFSF